MPDPSLFQRLKERKLVQWALAYLCGAWVLVEATNLVVEQFSWPQIVGQVVTILAFFGFFVVLVIAWYHGEKGRQWVSGPELLIIALLLLISGGVLSMIGGGEEEPELVGPPVSVAVEDERPSIAVLPFDNFSPDSDDAYIADGMQEQLVAMLAKIRGLCVRGRTSAMRYRDNPKSLPEIASELGVSYVIEGSVRIAGGQVSFTAQLVDAVRDEHLWADEFDSEFSVEDLVSIHREIAGHVVAEVQAVLTPEDEARLASTPTGSTDAYEEYLKGRFHWSTRSPKGLEVAAEHFRRAVTLDSTFAHAFSGLADCYAVLPYYSAEVRPEELFRSGEEAAQEAVRLAPGLAEARASLGYLRLVSRRDWEGAEEELRHAIALDPSYPNAHHWLSDLLAFSERFEESIEQEQEALDLDPLSFISNYTLAHRFYWGRRFPEAIPQYEKTVELHPLNYLGWAGLAEVLFLSDSIDYAVRSRTRADELFGTDPGVSETFNRMASEFRRSGTPASLPPAFDTVTGWSAPMKAQAAMLVGDTNKALTWLEQAVQEDRPDLLFVRVSPLYDPIRDNPRFQALLEEFGDDVGR